jgi:hypothetical protein
MAIPTKEFPPLTFTDNNLSDVVRFIKDHNVVALHTKKACRVFHSVPLALPEAVDSLKNVRVIYLNCNSHEGLLDDGEWEYYIKQAVENVHELGLDSLIRRAVIEQSSVPNKTYIQLGN